jgi:hypothetical protein
VAQLVVSCPKVSWIIEDDQAGGQEV